MVGILLVTHGNFCHGILDSIRMVAGEPEGLDCLAIREDDNIDGVKAVVANKVTALDSGDGTLVFVDMLGGSPFNVVAQYLLCAGNSKVECVAGLNLPMVLESLDMRDEHSLEDMVSRCVQIGAASIVDVRKELG